jgi:hypothetical protein
VSLPETGIRLLAQRACIFFLPRKRHFGVSLEDKLGGGGVAGQESALVVDFLEGGEDVLGVVAVDAEEVKEGGVEFGQQFGPFGLVPLVESSAFRVFRPAIISPSSNNTTPGVKSSPLRTIAVLPFAFT